MVFVKQWPHAHNLLYSPRTHSLPHLLFKRALNRIFLYTPEMLENPTWHQKQSNIPQLSPPRGRGRWCCPPGTGCSSPSCLSLGERGVRGCPGATPEHRPRPAAAPRHGTNMKHYFHACRWSQQRNLCCWAHSQFACKSFMCFFVSLQVYYQCTFKFRGIYQKKIQIKVLCGSTSREFKILYEQPHFHIKAALLIILSFSHVPVW